jgi:hypothetical protein
MTDVTRGKILHRTDKKSGSCLNETFRLGVINRYRMKHSSSNGLPRPPVLRL